MVISSVKPAPLTVKVCIGDAVPEQVVKLFGAPETVIAGTTTIFEELVIMGFKEVL